MAGLNEKEYSILKIIGSNTSPSGSGAISRQMKMLDNDISEATIGRYLRELDHLGLTEKKGYMGRVLTSRGEAALDEYEHSKELQKNTALFMRLTKAEAKKELLHILVARRAIERETCRLAAENIADEDLEILTGIVDLHYEHVSSGRSGAKEDSLFHATIARMSKNKLLATALDLIRRDGYLSPVLEYIRERVGSTIVADHRKILEAISSRDPEAAEEAMVSHISNVMADVNKYWDAANRENGE